MINEMYLISILSNFLNGRKSDTKSALKEGRLTEETIVLAKSQQIEAVLYYQTYNPYFRSAYSKAISAYANRSHLLSQLHAAFTQASVPYIVFKGPEIAAYYRVPALRAYGDIDILVREADKEKAGEILENTGFRCGNKAAEHEWCYGRSNSEIELHHRLLYDDNLNEERLLAFTDTVWEHSKTADGIKYQLEPEFHFVFLLLHLRKHFLWAGVGIRQFMDLAAMIKNNEQVNGAALDYDNIAEYIKTCCIEKFASTCFALIERWFGIRIPANAAALLPTAALTDDFYNSVTEKILSGTVFGDMSRDNLVDNAVFNTAKKRGKITSALNVIFLPYEQMKLKYPTMGKYKILLPLMWLRRMIEAVFKHTAVSGLEYAGKFIGTGSGKRAAELEAWGL